MPRSYECAGKGGVFDCINPSRNIETLMVRQNNDEGRICITSDEINPDADRYVEVSPVRSE
jgi:hypothetical protein